MIVENGAAMPLATQTAFDPNERDRRLGLPSRRGRGVPDRRFLSLLARRLKTLAEI